MSVLHKYFSRWQAVFGVFQKSEAPPPSVLPQAELEILLFLLKCAEFLGMETRTLVFSVQESGLRYLGQGCSLSDTIDVRWMLRSTFCSILS